MTLSEQIKQVMPSAPGDCLPEQWGYVDIIRQLTDIVKQQHEALEKLKAQDLGDYVYDVRSRAAESGDGFEGSSWDHPDVIEFSSAIDGIDKALTLSAPIVKGV